MTTPPPEGASELQPAVRISTTRKLLKLPAASNEGNYGCFIIVNPYISRMSSVTPPSTGMAHPPSTGMASHDAVTSCFDSVSIDRRSSHRQPLVDVAASGNDDLMRDQSGDY